MGRREIEAGPLRMKVALDESRVWRAMRLHQTRRTCEQDAKRDGNARRGEGGATDELNVIGMTGRKLPDDWISPG